MEYELNKEKLPVYKTLEEIETILRKNIGNEKYDYYKSIFEEGIEKYTYQYPECEGVYGNKEYAAWRNFYLKVEKEIENIPDILIEQSIAKKVLGVILRESLDSPTFYYLW